MFPFSSQTVLLIAGVSMAVCSPAIDLDLNKEGENLDITEVVDSMAQLSGDKIKALTKPLRELSANLGGTVFGSFFAYIADQLQHPSSPVPIPDDLKVFSKSNGDIFNSFVSALQQLPEKAIERSQSQFGQIKRILGESQLAQLFEQISSILKTDLRQVLLRIGDVRNSMAEDAAKVATARLPVVVGGRADGGVSDAGASGYGVTFGETETAPAIDEPASFDSVDGARGRSASAVKSLVSRPSASSRDNSANKARRVPSLKSGIVSGGFGSLSV